MYSMYSMYHTIKIQVSAVMDSWHPIYSHSEVNSPRLSRGITNISIGIVESVTIWVVIKIEERLSQPFPLVGWGL